MKNGIWRSGHSLLSAIWWRRGDGRRDAKESIGGHWPRVRKVLPSVDDDDGWPKEFLKLEDLIKSGDKNAI